MLDIKFIRENPDIVKENIKKKFQDEKLPPEQAGRYADGSGQEGPQQAG